VFKQTLLAINHGIMKKNDDTNIYIYIYIYIYIGFLTKTNHS